jgi:hypothetical protein
MRTQVLLDNVIKPSLNYLGDKYNGNAPCQLLLATCAQESNMGKYIKQINGPALGIMQIEPATHKSIWRDYVDYRPDLKTKLLAMLPDAARGDTQIAFNARNQCLITNLAYSVCIARLVYYRNSMAMPSFDDKSGMWDIYKTVYNTHLGAAKRHEFDDNWKRFIEFVEY